MENLFPMLEKKECSTIITLQLLGFKSLTEITRTPKNKKRKAERPSMFSHLRNMKKQNKLKKHDCLTCGDEFKTKKDLTNHAKSMHKENKDKHCYWCPFEAKSIQELNSHKKKMHSIHARRQKNYKLKGLEPQFKCPEPDCGFKCYIASILIEHKKKVHESVETFENWNLEITKSICCYCKESCKNNTFKEHIRTCRHKKEKNPASPPIEESNDSDNVLSS